MTGKARRCRDGCFVMIKVMRMEFLAGGHGKIEILDVLGKVLVGEKDVGGRPKPLSL